MALSLDFSLLGRRPNILNPLRTPFIHYGSCSLRTPPRIFSFPSCTNRPASRYFPIVCNSDRLRIFKDRELRWVSRGIGGRRVEEWLGSNVWGALAGKASAWFVAILCGILLVRCQKAFAVGGAPEVGLSALGQQEGVFRSAWLPKLLQVLRVLREQGLVLTALLGLSAFFSMAETAITTLWPWKVRELAEKEAENGVFRMLSSDVTRFLTTILIGTTVVNIGATALVTEAATAIFGEAGISAATGVMTNLSKGSTSIMDYLGRIKAVADQLAASGNNISDKEKVQQTLNGLGHDYHAFITALEVLPVLPSFNEQGKLLQHEMNMKRVIERTDQGNSQNVLAMNVKFGKSHGNSNHGGRDILPTPHNQDPVIENNVPQGEDPERAYNRRIWLKMKIKKIQHSHQVITKAIIKNRATTHISIRVLSTVDD
ncbi:DUF21 domain-containing protein [Nymphaea thermarum]|nr:DUF21 domain-containing protein [Nymphaea thermarum]